MNIQDAVKEALRINGGIYRESEPEHILIIPTNTDACCIVVNMSESKAWFRWNPNSGDLAATDWKVTGGSWDELGKE